MPNNVARQGCGSFNPNSRKTSRQERKKDNNNSDNSGSDGKNTVQQKRSRTISEQAMDEDIVADTAADAGVEVLASSPQENNTASTSLSSHPNIATALSAPNATDDDPPVDRILIQSPTFSIERNDFQAAAAPNTAPETLKNFTTNKALIDAVNNTFLEMYESDLGAKAVNVPLSLNSYKPKRWAYVTFNSQETMDAAMEQIIGFRGHTLQWNLPDNTNKLCHRCGKLGCAPNQCPSRQERGRTRGRNLVAALKERFNINQPARPNERSRSGSRSRLRSKDPGNSQPSQPQQPSANTRLHNNPHRDRSKFIDKCDRLVSFSTVLRTPPPLSTPNQSSTISPHEAANILSLLKSLQHDMAEVCDRITALELNDRCMTRIKQHLGLLPPPDILATNQSSDMLKDAPAISNSTVALTPFSAPIDLSNISSPSSTSQEIPSSTQTRDEIQAINAKHSAIENKLNMLANSISGFIRSITSSSSSSNSASTAGSN
ncbi:hypothetical protein RclHR1_09240007 [Rhizophagus clarus]|uniref:RRM domain-containing protein n=1 Tax=Rhizophagus clarus TaxID=94130 RepID=A0A2Z6S9U9_9GLOM|nr:hypothetical protein RclHR1_09240007 [Rhizophagus clarus]